MSFGKFDDEGEFELDDYLNCYVDSSIYDDAELMAFDMFDTSGEYDEPCSLYRTYTKDSVTYVLRYKVWRFVDSYEKLEWDADYVFSAEDVNERRKRLLFYIRFHEMESVESVLKASYYNHIYWISIDVEYADGNGGYFTTVELTHERDFSKQDCKNYVGYFDSYVDAKNFAWDICEEMKKVRKSRIYVCVDVNYTEFKDHVSYFVDKPYFDEIEHYRKR